MEYPLNNTNKNFIKALNNTHFSDLAISLIKEGKITHTKELFGLFIQQISELKQAAETGDVKLLEALDLDSRSVEELIVIAATNGQLAALMCLNKGKGDFWQHDSILTIAAKNGHLDCVKYLHKSGCPLSNHAFEEALENGHLQCMEYLHQRNCPRDPIGYGQRQAANNGYIECFKFLHKNGYLKNDQACFYAVMGGKLECLQYLLASGWPIDDIDDLPALAAQQNLECLKYVHNLVNPEKIQYCDSVCSEAAGNGQLECLKFAHMNGYPVNQMTFLLAYYWGHLDCVKYLCENGFYGDKYLEEFEDEYSQIDDWIDNYYYHTYHRRVEGGQRRECLIYLHENGFTATRSLELPCKDYLPASTDESKAEYCYYCIYTKNRELIEKQQALKFIMLKKFENAFRAKLDYLNLKGVNYEQFYTDIESVGEQNPLCLIRECKKKN